MKLLNESDSINKIEFIYDDTNNKLVDALKFFDTVKDNDFNIIQVRNSSDNSLDMEITKNSDNTYDVVYQGFYRTWNGPGYHTRPAKRKRSYKRLSALFDFITTWYNVNYDKIKREADPYYEDPNDSPHEVLTYSGLQLTPAGKRAKIRSAISDLTNMSDAKRILKDFDIDVIKKDDRNYELVKDNEKYTLYILDNPNEVIKDLLKGAFKLLKINENLDSIKESKNPLKAAARRHKRKQKGLSPFCYLNPNAGNVEHNVAFFNMAMGSGDAAGTGGSEGMGEAFKGNINDVTDYLDLIRKQIPELKLKDLPDYEIHIKDALEMDVTPEQIKQAIKNTRYADELGKALYDLMDKKKYKQKYGESMKEELRIWGDEEISAQNSLVKWEHALEDFLENNNIEYDQVKCDIFDYGTNIVIVNPKDIEEVAQEIEDHYGFKTTIEDNNIYVDVTEEYEDEYGDIKTRVAKRYHESLDLESSIYKYNDRLSFRSAEDGEWNAILDDKIVDTWYFDDKDSEDHFIKAFKSIGLGESEYEKWRNKLMLKEDLSNKSKIDLKQLANMIDYNGAEYRGAEIPEPVHPRINQANIPDNMRLKQFDVNVLDKDNIIRLDYITQEPFTTSDAEKLKDEVERMINYIAEDNLYEEPFKLILHVTARDGESYGDEEFEININQSIIKENLQGYTLDSKLYDYFKETNPNDPFGDDIDKEATFRDLFNAINDNADVYEVIFGDENSADSIVREELFNGLANILNISYDNIYYAWLGYDSLLESNNIIDIRKELNRIDSEEYRDLLNMYDSLEPDLTADQKSNIVKLIYQDEQDKLDTYINQLWHDIMENPKDIDNVDLGTFYKHDDLLGDGKFYKHESLENLISEEENLKSDLLSIPYVTEVKFEKYDKDLNYIDNWNEIFQLIALIDVDIEYADIDFVDYLKEKSKLKDNIKNTFKKYGFKYQDPPEYNGSYYYLVLEKIS